LGLDNQERLVTGTFRIARLFGFEINVHWSWFFIFFLVTASFATSVLEEFYPELTETQRWVVAGFISLLFFCSILLHEMSHSVVARRYGIPVPGITLFVFGGVSTLGKEPASARQEFWIAIVGPLTSVLIAIVLGIAYFPLHELDHGAAAISSNLAFINLAIGIFNLVPGFPLDGGRVLRSLFWVRKHDLLGATRLASKVGQGVAYVIMAVGVLFFLFHDLVTGIWFFLIGNFLKGAAEASYAQLFTDTMLKGIPVDAVTRQDYIAISPELTLDELAEGHVLAGHGRCFLITAGEELLGLITLTDLRRTPRDTWRTTTVYRAMTPFAQLKTVSAKDDLTRVMAMMAGGDLNQIPVVEGKLVRGLIHRADVLRYIQVRQEIGASTERSAEPVDAAAPAGDTRT
jgi:Zn-dependent protease